MARPTPEYEPDDDAAPLICDINITPLTDVILVLLIIFMVTSSAMVDAAREGHLDITLPSVQQHSDGSQDAQVFVIGVSADEKLMVDGTTLDADALDERLKSLFSQRPQTHVVLDADGALSHHRVVLILDKVRQAGFQSISIGTLADP